MFSVVDLIPVVLTTVAALIDLRCREIPDWIWISLMALIPLRVFALWPACVWWHFPAGAIAGLLIAWVVARGDRFGGGDVKLFAALGGWFGILAVVPLALWCAIAGLPLAIFAAARKQKDFAFGPAILASVIIHWIDPRLLGRIGGWN